jgi:hypothetical protein
LKIAVTAFAVASACLQLGGCGTGKPADNGTVVPDTGGRGGHSISVGDELLLMYDDEYNRPWRVVNIMHEGSKITIAPVSGEPMPAWLKIAPLVRTGQYSTDTVFTFVPQQEQPHTEQVTLRFTVSDQDGTNAVYDDMLVRAVRIHHLSRRHEYVTYTPGSAVVPTSRLGLVVNGDWKAVLDGSWLSASLTSGTGNAFIDLTAAPQSLAEGNYVGYFNVTTIDGNSQRTSYYSMHLGVEPRRLDTDKRGLAFASTAGASRTVRPLRVIDTAGLQGQWRINDDAAWLSTNATSGAGDAVVQVTADPAGLADGQYSATLTLSPDNEPGFSNVTIVRVGFHVDHTAPGNTSVPLAGTAPTAGLVAADPVRPFVYGFTNSGSNTTLRVWNVHSGALVDSVEIPNLNVARAHVSPDGSQLLVSDVTDVSHTRLLPIALGDTTRTVGASWTSLLSYPGHNDFAFAHINGKAAVAWSVFQLLSPENGMPLATLSSGTPDYLMASTPPSLAVADDGRRGCMVVRYRDTSLLHYLALGYRAGAFSGGVADPATLTGDVMDCELDSGGRFVFAVTSSTIYRFAYQARQPDVQRAVTRGGTLLRLDNGDIYLSGDDGTWTHYDANLNALAEHRAGSAAQLGIVSGDETRLLELVDSNGLSRFELRDRDF